MNRQVRQVAWYRFRATLRRRWTGYVALAVLVGLVGGVALASVVAARRTDSSYPDYLAGTNPSDLIVQPSTTPAYAPAFLDGSLARLKHVAHVESAEGFNAATLTPRGGIATFLITQVELVASLDGLYSDQDRLTIVGGHRANPARADQVVATTQAASVLGLHVGSHISVGVLPNAARTHSDFRKLKLTVVGLGVLNTQVVQDDIDRDRTGFLIGTPALARMIVPCCANYEYVGLQLAGGSSDDAAVEQEYDNLLSSSHFTQSGKGAGSLLQVYVTAAIEAQAQRAIRPEAIALGLFGLIAGLAALIIGAQSISRQLREGAADTAVLRALGAGPAATAADGLPGILAATAAGSLLAAAVAAGLSPLTLFGPARAVEPQSGIYLDWAVLGLGALALAIILGAVAGVIGFRQAPHRAATRIAAGHVPGAVRAGLAAGLPVPAVAGLRFALEPGQGRTAVPVRSVIAASGLAVLVVTTTLAFGASLSTLISHPALYGWNFSYALYSTDGYGAFSPHFIEPKLRADKMVAATTGVYFATAQVGGQTVPVITAPARAAVAPPVLSGHAVDGPGQIVLGPATLAQLHLRIGDSVRVSEGQIVAPRSLRIVGTAALPAIGTVLGVHASMGTGALIDTSVVNTATLAAGFGSLAGPNAILIRMRPGVSQAAGMQSLQRIAGAYRQLMRSPKILAASHGLSQIVNVNLLAAQRPAEIVNYKSMGAMPEVLAGGLAAGAVGALGLTLNASIRRRRRDFALLKTIGFTRSQLAAAVAWQATVTAAIGLVIGIPLGIAAGRWLWLAFASELAAVPDPVIPAVSITLAAVAALILANLVAAVPGLRAARTPAATVLRAE
jgi:ABC-type antimicrobial peptide transport system permease subunit